MRCRTSVSVLVLSIAALLPSTAFAQTTYGQAAQQQQGGYGSGAAPNGNMQAGGLAPPSSADTESQETEQHLEEAEQKDSGRGLEIFYLNAEAGITHLGLQTFKANNLVDSQVVGTTQTGPTFGAGLGLRFLFITAGARFRLSNFSDFQVWTLGAELGLRIPLGMIEPYFTVGGGFAKMGSFSASNIGGTAKPSDVSISGYDIRAGFGLDVYVTPVFSIGGNLTGDVIGFSRGKVNTAPAAANDVYAQDGSSVGLGGTLTVVAGLHF